LQGSKGRYHENQILAKIGQKSQKMAITSIVYNIHAECDFQIGFMQKGQSGVSMATNFGTKTAINAF